MFCEKCGSKLPDNAKFCGSCGAKTESVQPAAVHDQPAPPPPPPPPAQATPSQSYPPPVQAPQSYTPLAQAAPSQSYTAPAQAPVHSGQRESEPLSIGNYICMFLLMCIPLVGIILLFVWAFGDRNWNRKNFARAMLIMSAIMLLFWIIAGGLIMNALSGIMGGFY